MLFRIKNNAVITNNTASNILKVSPNCSNNFTILLSAIGSLSAAAMLYVMLNIVSFNIGTIHMLITTIIPTKPTAFFNSTALPSIVSIESPSIFPTTGIRLDIAAFAVLAVILIYATS